MRVFSDFFFLNKNMLRIISANRKDRIGHNMDFPVIQCIELSLFSSLTATIRLTSWGGPDVMTTCNAYVLQRQLENFRSSHKVHILQTTPQLYFFLNTEVQHYLGDWGHVCVNRLLRTWSKLLIVLPKRKTLLTKDIRFPQITHRTENINKG